MPWIGSTSTSGMLRTARRKLASISAPSTINALAISSLPKRSLSALVLASSSAAFSRTTMPPSLALAERAGLSASARTFLGRPISWLRGVGPKARPPPRKMLTRAEPWRALPVPFCRYIFLPVRLISARFLTLWVPARRLASCQVTQRWIRSVRGLSPKIASESSTEPAAAPSRVVTLSSMSGPLARRARGFAARFRPGGRRGLRSCRLAPRQAELAGLRHRVGQLLLHRVAHGDPAALGARHRALHQDEA